MSNLQSFVSPSDVRARIYAQNPEQQPFTNANGLTITGGKKQQHAGGKMKHEKKTPHNQKHYVEKCPKVERKCYSNKKTKYTLF